MSGRRLSISAFAAVAGLALIILSFQNCSVRRLEGVGELGGMYQGAGDSSSNPGGSTGQTSETSGSSGGSSSCLIPAETSGTIMGMTDIPAIKSSIATITRSESQGQFVPAKTVVAVSSASECISRAMVSSSTCSTPSSSCSARKYLQVSVIVTCDDASKDATTCKTMANSLNTEIDLKTSNLSQHIMVAVTSSSNVCQSSAATSYALNFQDKKGKVKILKSPTLANGGVFSVQLIGVELIKNGTVTTDKITVDGTYAGEIVTQPNCQ